MWAKSKRESELAPRRITWVGIDDEHAQSRKSSSLKWKQVLLKCLLFVLAELLPYFHERGEALLELEAEVPLRFKLV